MRKILMLMLGSLLLFSCGNPSQVSFQDLSLESLEGEQHERRAGVQLLLRGGLQGDLAEQGVFGPFCGNRSKSCGKTSFL
jgi:hypothetical protein